MTDSYPPPLAGTYTGGPPVGAPPVYTDGGGDSPDPKDVAKEQAAGVGQGAAEAGQHVAGVAKEQTAQVAAEAGKQAKDLLNQAQVQLKQQSGVQQEKLVTGLRSLSDELGSMSKNADQPGVASDLARQAAERTGSIAGWLDGREPAAILEDVNSFARTRPGAFLAIAGGIGFLAGRLTRGLKAQSDAGSADPVPAPGAYSNETYSSAAYSSSDLNAALPPAPPVGTYVGDLR